MTSEQVDDTSAAKGEMRGPNGRFIAEVRICIKRGSRWTAAQKAAEGCVSKLEGG